MLKRIIGWSLANKLVVLLLTFAAVVGGGQLFYGALMWRFLPIDFRARSFHHFRPFGDLSINVFGKICRAVSPGQCTLRHHFLFDLHAI